MLVAHCTTLENVSPSVSLTCFLKPVLDNSPVAYGYNSSTWLPVPCLAFLSSHPKLYPLIPSSGLTGFIYFSQRSMFSLPASFPHTMLSACNTLLPAFPTFPGEFYSSLSSQLKHHFLQKTFPDSPTPLGPPAPWHPLLPSAQLSPRVIAPAVPWFP